MGPVKLDWAMKMKNAVRNNLAFLLQGNVWMTAVGNGLGYLIQSTVGFLYYRTIM